MILRGGKAYLALDDCEICPPLGYVYYPREGVLICLNCQAPISISTVGIAGGCNPIPIQFAMQGGDGASTCGRTGTKLKQDFLGATANVQILSTGGFQIHF